MNTVFFSIYDSGYRSSALLLNNSIGWSMIDQTMYKRHIPDADDVADYDDLRLFVFFSQMFSAEIGRVVIVIDGEVYRVRYNCAGGFFGYEMVNGKVRETE